MQKTALLLIFVSYLISLPASAAEIDSVTPRKLRLDDSLDAINSVFNQRIELGIERANPQRSITDGLSYIDGIDDMDVTWTYEDCDEELLYSELRKAIFQSFTASWGLKGYDLDEQMRGLLARQSYSLSLNDSIYRDIDYIEGFSLNLKELSDVVTIDKHLVGLDKIGHFFAQGWQYFEMTTFDDQSLEQAMAWGKQQESGKFGYSTTGIFSFADLVANFNGWRFWNRVLLKEKDPLKGMLANFFSGPYVSCDIQLINSIKNRKIVRAWEYNARFDLSDYIDGAWDEGNNCNSYADPVIEKKVSSRITQVDADFSCPAVPAYCLEAKKKYGYYSKFLLHPYCLVVDDN